MGPDYYIYIKRADGKAAEIRMYSDQLRDEEGQEIQEDGENYPDYEKTLKANFPRSYRQDGLVGIDDVYDGLNWDICEEFIGWRADADEEICEWIREGDRLRFGDCLFIKRADGAVAEVEFPDGVEIDDRRGIDLAASLKRYYPETYKAWEAKTWVADPECYAEDEGFWRGYNRCGTYFCEGEDEELKEWVLEGGAGQKH